MAFCETLALRADVAARLGAALPGRNLYELAVAHGVTVRKQGRLNKGWVGQTIERVARLKTSNLQARDGFDFELKSTSLEPRDGGWQSMETIKITQLNPSTILEETFESSVLWSKLASLIVVGCHHESSERCTTVRIATIDLTDPQLVGEIRAFWEDIRNLAGEGSLAAVHDVGTSDDYIQLRPTGDGKQLSLCPVTGERFPARAFYGTKRLVRRILGL